MRVAVLTSHPVQYYGPLFRALAARTEVHVFFAHRASAEDQGQAGFGQAFEWDTDITAGYEHRFLKNVARRPSADRFFGCDVPGFAATLKAGRFDALILTGWGLKAYLQGLFAARRAGIPVIVRGDSHLDIPRTWLRQQVKSMVYPPFLRLFDAAAYVGQRSRAYYEHYEYPASRLFFAPHCVDTKWYEERATPAARETLRQSAGIAPHIHVALFAGKLIRRKRPLDLVAAAASCRASGAALEVMVAGDGALRAAVEQAAQAAGVPLHILGFCNQSKMPAVYAAADFLVLPSDIETWGLVANEALACDRPVIVSDACGCAPDFAANRYACLTFPVSDVRSLASAMNEVMMEPHRGAPRTLSNRYRLDDAAMGIMAALEFVIQTE